MTTFPTNQISQESSTRDIRAAISLRGISKQYQLSKQASKTASIDFNALWALRDVTLEVFQGEALGIIGRNGAGKTTLLNIIAGILSPTNGEIKTAGRVLGLFNLGVGFQDELTGRENIFLNGALIGAARKELQEKLAAIIDFSELGNFIDMPLGTYSQGMRLRLAFSILVSLDFDILAIDEVLAVGDALFQSKCFERLAGFKRDGKTMVITNQNISFIERFCDRVAVLNHGSLIFYGDVKEGVNKYLFLLNTEKFFVAPAVQSKKLIETTMKWSEDMSNWGRQLGTNEVRIDSVKRMNRFGFKCDKIKTGGYLKIKVNFNVLNLVKNPHFGIAIFRQDGVYCFGPNTRFDGYNIRILKPGKGWFALTFPRLFLAPGDYRISVVVWDEHETVAFNYRCGYYQLTVMGPQIKRKELLAMPYVFASGSPLNKLNLVKAIKHLAYEPPREQWGKRIDSEQIRLESVKIFDAHNKETTTLLTNQPARININFTYFRAPSNNFYLWVGVYRDDGVYCQGIYLKSKKKKHFSIRFPELLLLPGGYKISLGVWDNSGQRFIMCHHGGYPLQMVFTQQDHGTIYLKHTWSWNAPK